MSGNTVDDAEHPAHDLGAAGEQEAQLEWPLSVTVRIVNMILKIKQFVVNGSSIRYDNERDRCIRVQVIL